MWRRCSPLAIAVLVATGTAAMADMQAAPSGPYSVGRRATTWRDDTRADPVDGTRRRDVPIVIWYPAAHAPVGPREVALPGAWGERRLDAVARKLGPDMATAMRTFRVHAVTDAPLAPGGQPLPVVLFTPGLGWLATDYSILIEDLASHGYVVVGLSPAGFADVVRFPDGRDVQRTLANGAAVGTDQVHVHEDALFVLRRVRQLAVEAGSFLHGRLDLGRIATLGHSLGGTTAHVVAARDSSVRAAVNIDGDPMGSVLEVRPRQPLLLVSSESPSIDEAPPFPSAEHRARVLEGLERSEQRRTNDWIRMSADSTSAWRIRVLGTRHSNFVDVAMFSDALTTPQQRWMKVGPIAGSRGLLITAELVRAFFAHTLLGTPADDLLRAPHQRFPEARLEPGAGPQHSRPSARP